MSQSLPDLLRRESGRRPPARPPGQPPRRTKRQSATALAGVPLFSGFTYFLMGPAHWAFGLSSGRRRKAVETRIAPVAGV